MTSPPPEETSNGEAKYRESLHCATDDGAVRRFGREDDVLFFYPASSKGVVEMTMAHLISQPQRGAMRYSARER